MRIGLVSQSYDNRTGIGRIVKALALEFVGLGHAVSCAAQHFEDVDRRITECHVPSLSSSKALNKMLFTLNGSPFSGGEVDIINTFGVGRGANIVTAQSCHRAGMELLRSKSDQFLESRGLGLYDRVSLIDERVLLTVPTTKRIMAVSQLVKSQIETFYKVAPEKVTVVPNGVDYTLFKALRTRVDRSGQRMSLGFSPDDFVLLFVGNEFGRKGLKTLLQSLAALNDRKLRLLVVGGGDRQAYERRTAELGIMDNVSFMGNIPAPETMYLVADAFVIPSLYEPFGIVILEAMAAGVPVITSKSCGASEGMTDREHLLLLENPASVEELTEAIGLLSRDETMRRKLIAAGVEKAKEFSWDRIARKVLSVYEDVRRL